MPVIGLDLVVELDGRPLDLSPLIRNYYVTDARLFSFHLDDFAGYETDLPMTDGLSLISVVAFQSTETITVRVNGQSDGGILVNAGGLVVLGQTHLTATPLVSILNVSGRQAQIRGVVGGRA